MDGKTETTNVCEMEPINVTVEGVGTYEGFTSGQHWNGWECPSFEKDVAQKLLNDVIKANEYGKVSFDEKKDTFFLENDGDDTEDWQGFDIKTDEGIKHVYGIGSHSWVWSKVTD